MAGTKASTPPTSEPQIGEPSMITASPSTPSATAIARERPATRWTSRPARRNAAPGELAVGEVAHAREPPADRRRVAEHGVDLQRRPQEHVHHEEPEHEARARRGAGRAGGGGPRASASPARAHDSTAMKP